MEEENRIAEDLVGYSASQDLVEKLDLFEEVAADCSAGLFHQLAADWSRLDTEVVQFVVESHFVAYSVPDSVEMEPDVVEIDSNFAAFGQLEAVVEEFFAWVVGVAGFLEEKQPLLPAEHEEVELDGIFLNLR